MARWGNVDYRRLQALQRRMQKLEQVDIDSLCIDISNDLAKRLLRKVKKRTPVGVYPPETGKTGGTLRNSWNVTRVEKQGYQYSIEVFSDVEYAIYVEFGHRTSNHRSWVPGKFMLTVSEKEIEDLAPKLIQRKLEAKIREVFEV